MLKLKGKWILKLVMVMAVGVLLLAGCGGQGDQAGEQPSEKNDELGTETASYVIKWGTAPAGGTWQALGTAMLDDVLKANPNLKGSTAPLGGTANIIGVSEKKLNVAFSLSATLGDAWEGRGVFKEKGELRNFRVLAVLFPEPTQIAVYEDSGIDSVEDLKGKRITPGPKGSAVEQDSVKVLNAYGMSYEDMKVEFLSFADAAQQMIDGHLDSIFYGAMICPAPPIVNVSSQKKIKLLSLSDEVIDSLVKNYKGMRPYTIPPGTYEGIDYPVKGICTTVVVIASEDMPDDVAYSIVKTIADNYDRYATITKAMMLSKKEDMSIDTGMPFHPGALKYYKEQGMVN